MPRVLVICFTGRVAPRTLCFAFYQIHPALGTEARRILPDVGMHRARINLGFARGLGRGMVVAMFVLMAEMTVVVHATLFLYS